MEDQGRKDEKQEVGSVGWGRGEVRLRAPGSPTHGHPSQPPSGASGLAWGTEVGRGPADGPRLRTRVNVGYGQARGRGRPGRAFGHPAKWPPAVDSSTCRDARGVRPARPRAGTQPLSLRSPNPYRGIHQTCSFPGAGLARPSTETLGFSLGTGRSGTLGVLIHTQANVPKSALQTVADPTKAGVRTILRDHVQRILET